MMRTTVFLLLIATATTFGCGGGSARESGNEHQLFLYAGAGLRLAVEDLVREFEDAHGGTVTTDYAGSETLLNRIRLSKRGDLYMPGDKYYVSMAADEGLISDRDAVCYFVPTILVRKGYDKTEIKDIEDLLDENVRLGIGGDACAIGRKTEKIFEKNGISLERLKQNVEFHSLTVNELGNHIGAGSLDAVIVWDAVAALYKKAGRMVEIPPDKNVISTVDVGILSFSKNEDLAREFMKFAASKRGKKIFAAHDYTVKQPE